MTRITGSFREWGGGSTDSYIGVQPFVRAVVELPRLDLKHPVDFLVDTGAARSTLHPQSMVRLGISLEIYVPTLISDMTGVGGGASYGEEEAVLHFRNAQVPMRILVGPLVKNSSTFLSQAESPHSWAWTCSGWDVCQSTTWPTNFGLICIATKTFGICKSFNAD